MNRIIRGVTFWTPITPIQGSILHAGSRLWLMKPEVLADFLMLTNVQPLVLFGFNHLLQRRLTQVIEMAPQAPRRLVVLLPDPYIRLQTNRWDTSLSPEDLENLPLEDIGAYHLRQYLLNNGDKS